MHMQTDVGGNVPVQTTTRLRDDLCFKQSICVKLLFICASFPFINLKLNVQWMD